MVKHIVFATVISIALLGAWVGTHPKQAFAAMVRMVPVAEIHGTHQVPNPWAAQTTEGVQTSAQYSVQQAAMRTVLIDGHAIDDFCKEAVAEAKYDGIAVPQARLVCIHPEIWAKQDLVTYYLLAHELAHIALAEFGRSLGDNAHMHRDEHFVLTIHVMNELLKMQGMPAPARFIITKAMSLQRGYCQKHAHC